jgi:D-arabinose 1-dehydrogenase-like Zn-dependent alcohol dehydrogenase
MHTNHPGTVTTGRAVTQTGYGGPEVLRLTEVPLPVPGAGEVLVRVHAASVNARDWHVMRGEPRVARLMDRTLFGRRGPRVAVRGTDFAGVVEAVGTDVTAWRPGDVVFGEGVGTFAQRAIASANRVAAVPAGTTFEQAAALPLAAATALLCLDETGLEAGGRVLVNGASGGVGTFAVQAAKAMGLTSRRWSAPGTSSWSSRWVSMRSSITRPRTSPAAAGPGMRSWTWWGTTGCVTCGPQSGLAVGWSCLGAATPVRDASSGR